MMYNIQVKYSNDYLKTVRDDKYTPATCFHVVQVPNKDNFVSSLELAKFFK